MTALFYQSYWSTVGKDVVAAVKSFFHSSHLLRSMNQTLITLILKVGRPTMPENQSAFVGGRQILDSILIAHEIMHSLKNRRYGRKGWVALKLDMAKAFDRKEWSYLESVLRKFGFNETWIRWVMSCITREATSLGCHAIDEILRKYEIAFGQMVNRDKSSLFFSPNTPADVNQGISEALNIRFENHGGKYLGLPSIIGRSKTGVFQYVKDRGGLGFCDFHDFNLALLNKDDIWLMASVLYSNASCPKLASWAWRSICAGRTVLRKGWRWCIVDGKAINIWHDPWLPRSLNFRELSPAAPVDSLCHSVTQVSDLIDEVTHSWNIPLIKALFSDIDVEVILSIPISSHGAPDKGEWHYIDNGLFSVKSAYRLTRSSNVPHNSRERRIQFRLFTGWYLETNLVPDKNKMFLWRYSHNALAVLFNLFKKKIDVSPYCLRCNSAFETIEHLFFQCKSSKEVWENSLFANAVSPFWDSLSFIEWWIGMVQLVRNSSGVEDLHVILAILCWMLWKGRNTAYFDKKFWTCSTIVEKAITPCEEFKASTDPSSWLLPPPNAIKHNVDGAVNKKNDISSVGIVARNHFGEILRSISIPFAGFLSPHSTEALGFR
ncbi:uncharacterized protein LOC131321121 [Rhododendron vialii]|uniref:uncharacterized protein LOC131321121 n=1 Tax=Rhododendron vialii TaxID=182163 RepID=UPI00265F2449|nr:uncharacterized protein LOC131321121 [Rhododendron vialii]